MKNLRNIAIIAHVDHGKTTLVDCMFRQSGTYADHESVEDRAMDSNDIERERGITILAKCTSVFWGDVCINIVDTPGHADFGGEVERVLGMVDGVLLLVDASEGAMPQTKFVLSKALSMGLKPIVVVNKVDKLDARVDEVVDEVLDLFISLDASDSQLDFPVLYASAKEGWAVCDVGDSRVDLGPLFDCIVGCVPVPVCDVGGGFSMLVTMLHYEPYLGRVLTGRVFSGVARVNCGVKVLDLSGDVVENGRLSKLLSYRGLQKVSVDEAVAGDIVAVAGLKEATVTNTICSVDVVEPIASRPVDPPTLSMRFGVNSSPLGGRDGDKVTSSVIFDRLRREAEHNISICVRSIEDADAVEVQGRGELQLSILIENMRREGFELSVGRPSVVYRSDDDGNTLEPVEEVIIDVDDEYCGVIMESMGLRRGEMLDMLTLSGGKSRVKFLVPSRSLIGYHNQFMTETRGSGVMTRLFHGYLPFRGSVEKHRNGVLVSGNSGKVSAYSLVNLEDRGSFFVKPGDEVYEGMIVGMHNRGNDLVVNVTRAKQLSNMRSANKDDTVKVPACRYLTLEEAITCIEDDEVVEVTPVSIRLRKRCFKR